MRGHLMAYYALTKSINVQKATHVVSFPLEHMDAARWKMLFAAAMVSTAALKDTLVM